MCLVGRYFLGKLLMVLLMQDVWEDSFTWPLLVFLVSCCVYPLASSCAHTFSSMSTRARHVCFFFDYGALSLYSLGEWTETSRCNIYNHQLISYASLVLCSNSIVSYFRNLSSLIWELITKHFFKITYLYGKG